MRSIEYQTVDVFTDQRFGGNPLAVITDDAGLSTDEMQAIAREFNYSETTFVGPPEDPANTARVRIFTPSSELPFAGHPNVGTAYVLAQMERYRGLADMRFEEKAGLVAVTLRTEGGETVGATIQAPRRLEVGLDIDAEAIAACASLPLAEVELRNHRPVAASVGLEFIFAELVSVEALGRVRTNAAAFAEACERYENAGDRFSLFLYARTGEGMLRARMFAPLALTSEDPATGSASAALGALLAVLDRRTDGPVDTLIHQGVEMGRPSRLEVSAMKRGGMVEEVTVGGRCVPVMRGTLTL
jgi:trans-2,3-dihydro-3-hydroxyanthranilate isomerase